tara:strand:+ start:189 stop:455 length:267 start_codon:yes stop_codon:yes gene_type:complete
MDLSGKIIEEELQSDEGMVIDFSSGIGEIAKISVIKTEDVKQAIKKIERRIMRLDTEKYVGEYCFKANSFKKEIKKIIKEEAGEKLTK